MNFASQAAELGSWPLARHAFERGLCINSCHVLILERLLEVLLRLGDWEAAGQLARRILQRDPAHLRASSVAAAMAEAPTRSGAWRASRAILRAPLARGGNWCMSSELFCCRETGSIHGLSVISAAHLSQKFCAVLFLSRRS